MLLNNGLALFVVAVNIVTALLGLRVAWRKWRKRRGGKNGANGCDG